MPPKAKITKEMVIDAAFDIARSEGADSINARSVSARLGCSTQPVMYLFSTIEELKRAVYRKADDFHTEYLLRHADPQENVMMAMGLNYLRFSVNEPRLFRFLFQSGLVEKSGVTDLIESPETSPFLAAIQKSSGLREEKIGDVFLTLAMFVHGYASILANNPLKFDEEQAKAQLQKVYKGAILTAQEETK